MIKEIMSFLNTDVRNPLNKQIDDMREYLGGYTLEASDVVYKTIQNEAVSVKTTSETDTGIKLVVNASGSIKISASISNSNSRYDAYLKIYKNDEYVLRLTDTSSTSSEITIKKGDIFTFKLSSSTSSYAANLAANGLHILATAVPVSQGNLIELIEG